MKRVINRTGRKPRTVAADRGYGEKSVDDDLTDLGVTSVVIPRKGKPSAARRAEETPTSVPTNGEVANRKRRQNQRP